MESCLQYKYEEEDDALEAPHVSIPRFTEDDLDSCWTYYKQYLIDILNLEYSVEDARSDLNGLIGTQWDNRINQ